MAMALIAIFIIISLLELGVGIYFAHAYINATNLGLTTLGPSWHQLTGYWLFIGIVSFITGSITLFVSLKSWRQKRIHIGSMIIISLLFVLTLYMLGKLF